jgi:hypothetical protein
MQDACADGFRWYDFGDVSKGNQGLSQFKSKWGAEAKMIYRYSYRVPLDGLISAPHLPTSAARQLLHTAWQHMPIKMIGLLSDWCHALHYYWHSCVFTTLKSRVAYPSQ